jgi:hypothetical protein
LPVDGRVPLLHHPPVMDAARNQFSFTRVASKPAARRKSNFLSAATMAGECENRALPLAAGLGGTPCRVEGRAAALPNRR